jgi:hypothetical protein
LDQPFREELPMSATAFLRHRRAVAVDYINAALARSPKRVAEVLEEFNLLPGDLANLRANNDVLTIADRIAASKLDEEELDTLEQLNTLTVGERRAVHSPDVRADQFEDKLQHPCQETVGVGNMHDGPQAAEDLANVGTVEILDAYPPEDQATVDPTTREALADGAEAKAERIEQVAAGESTAPADPSKLAAHTALPEVVPNLGPAAEQVTAEDEQQPTDPDGNQAGVAATPVNIAEAADALRAQAAQDAKLVDKGDSAIDSMDRDALIAYAASNDLDIGEVKERTTPTTLRNRIRAAIEAKAAPADTTEGTDNG